MSTNVFKPKKLERISDGYDVPAHNTRPDNQRRGLRGILSAVKTLGYPTMATFLYFVLLTFSQTMAQPKEETLVSFAQPRFLAENRDGRLPERTQKETDFAQNAQGRPTARGLSQRRSRDTDAEDTKCQLTRQKISDLLDKETRTWLIDSSALEAVSGDLGVVVNCTREDDVILLSVDDEIRIPAEIVVPWNLTLSSNVASTDLVDGIFPKADRKVRFRCPSNGGVFHIRSHNVLLANLVFRGCSLDEEGSSIIQVGSCSLDRPPGRIRLHHLAFNQNSLDGSSGLSVSTSSCSSVEMIDVTFSKNICGDQCFARLAQENDLRGLRIWGNTRLSEESTSSSLMSSPPGSSSSVEGLTANSNELSILRVTEGNLEMRNAEIRSTRASTLLLDRAIAIAIANGSFHDNDAPVSGAAILANGVKSLSVSHCNFTSNFAENGAAVASFDGNLTINGCSFQDNAATVDAGSLLVANGTLELLSSNFENNTASGSGGAILLTASMSSRLSAVQCRNNTAENGGCLQTAASEDLVIRQCVFSGNNASVDGGGAAIQEGSSVLLEEVVWSANVAQLQGGGILIQNSSITCRRCDYLRNSATYGASFRVTKGMANAEKNSFVGNVAILGAGGVSALDAIIDLRDCFATRNIASFGSGVTATRSAVIIHNMTFEQNRAHTNRGGGFACYLSQATISNSSFFSNSATDSGGGIDMFTCNVTGKNLNFSGNDSGRLGGGISCARGTLFNLSDSVIQYNIAKDGAGIVIQSNTLARLSNCRIRSNSATDAGAIGVYKFSKLIIENSTISLNRAVTRGGAVRLDEGKLILLGGMVEDNEVSEKGGFLQGSVSSTFNATNCRLQNNRADNGGCLYIESQTQVFLRDCAIENNTATKDGGAVVLEDSGMSADANTLRRNKAAIGGSIMMTNSSLRLTKSVFTDGEATLVGGSIAATLNNTLSIVNTTFSNNRAETGGGICLSGSNLTAYGLKIFENVANETAGGILAEASSIFLCAACIFSNNKAGKHGGAVAFASSEPQSLALQLNNCTFDHNSADLGGAVHVSTQRHPLGCTETDASCTFVAATGNNFSNNWAETSGGAIFTEDPNVLRYSCSSRETEVPPILYLSATLEELAVLESVEDICPEWVANHANKYGSIIASYARSVKGFSVNDGPMNHDIKAVKNNELVAKNHRSGDALPVLLVEVLDGYGQSPALGVGDAFVQATMYAPNTLFSGEFNMAVNEKRKGFPPISGFQHPGHYEIQIDFSESGLEALTVKVDIRDCKLGEFAQENGMLCVPCSGTQYNFDPDASMCQLCPENGNCTSDVIHPNRGYWHRTPCSRHVQQCVSREACDFSDREDQLIAVTSDMESCDIDETLDRDYLKAQCKKGYAGFLCGACDDGYGHSWSFECHRCYHDSGTAILLVTSLFVLFLLCSFAIKSNLHTTQTAKHSQTNRISRKNRRLVPSKRRSSMDIPGNFEIMAISEREEEAGEVVKPELPASTSENAASMSDPTVAKITVVEIFKISINFLQVIAAAAIINLNWTGWMRSMLFAADFVSGAASAGITLPVDCLFDSHNNPPRSVMRSVIYLVIPLSILVFYIIFWIFLTRKHKENTWYFAKRALLSFLAVAYLTYVSITKTAINTLYCITVHHSTHFEDDHTDKYWALDTSLKCYEGSHAVLALTVGWPVLVIFSFGLPVFLSFLLIRQRSQEPGQNPWLADATGFLYRAYKERYIFWESVVMLRKAVLTFVVAFSYPLGTNIQGILAVCILTFANYIHVTCRPFDEPYSFLNAFETASLVVSQLTFASGLFFNDERTSDSVKVFLTLSLSIAIFGLLLILSYTFIKSAITYLKAVLEDQGMEGVQDWSIVRVLKAFLLPRVLGCIGCLFRKRNGVFSIPSENLGTSSNV